MTGLVRLFGLGVAVMLIWPASLMAQFPSEVVGFNGPPIDDPATSREMFQSPQFSGSTADFIVPNTAGEFDNNAAFRASGLQSEGAAALEAFFTWVDPADPDAWVRLTTFDGSERPNPALDTRGKVRFKLTNRSQIFTGTVGLCLGIRETGTDVGQMLDGGFSGPIEWVGVDTEVNAIIAGPDGIVDTEAAGDDIQVYEVGFDVLNADPALDPAVAVIEPGPNGDIDTIPAGDDVTSFGFFINANGGRTPIPAITLSPFATPYFVEWDLSTGEVSVDGSPPVGGIAPMTDTGNGVLDPASDRGTLEHVAIVNVASDTATDIDFAIDELQFEATVPDPVLAPRVVFPIIAGDDQVTVTDLMPSVDQVSLFVDDELVEARDVASSDDVVFDLDPPAATGEVYTATQRSGDSGETSAPSLPVEVLPEPPLYTFSILLDESGSGSCSLAAPGWEWVGVTSVTGWTPQGQPVFGNDGVWQTVDIPLNDDELIIPSFNGDGSLAPSPTGFYTMDSLWFSIADAAVEGPWEVFIDSVQLLDEFGEVTETILDMEDGTVHFPFPRGQSPVSSVDVSAVTSVASYDGVSSHQLEWSYGSLDSTESLGILQRIVGCGTSAPVDDTAAAIRFHLLLRNQPTAPDVALPEVMGPVVGNQDTVRVITDEAATSVRLYINGDPHGAAVPPTGTETDFSSLPLGVGDSVSAVQVIAAATSDLAYPRGVAAPPAPAVEAVLVPTQTTVELSNVLTAEFATASTVTVYVDGLEVASEAAGTETVVVTVPELMDGQVVTATQTVNGAEGSESAGVTVAVPAPSLTGAAPGDESVTVTDIHPLATDVTVYVDGSADGTAPTGGASTVEVPTSALFINESIQATQTIGGVEGAFSETVVVEAPMCLAVFADDFEVNTTSSWHRNMSTDAAATFNYDYGADAVPPSPNGSGTTLGLKFEANQSEGATNAVTVSPVGQNFLAADGYRLTFDMWINANGPFPAGGGGSTEFFTAGAGYDNATVNLGGSTGIGGWFSISGESGSSRDIRPFKDTSEQFPESGQYHAGEVSGIANNTNNDPYYFSLFGVPSPPEDQAVLHPAQTGNLLEGSAGFAWHEINIIVLGDRARWEINGVPIVTLDGTIGDPFSGFDGNISLGYMDVFTSISDNPAMSFGLADNVKIFVPHTPGGLGDWEDDGDVDLNDYEVFQDCLAGPNAAPMPATGPTCSNVCADAFDSDGDGDVDLKDYAAFTEAFGE